ncbi:MAG: hypothetical protein WBO31_14770, partial [Saprospiraceae bacterium]
MLALLPSCWSIFVYFFLLTQAENYKEQVILNSGCFDLSTPDETAFDSLCLHPKGLEGEYIQGYSSAQQGGNIWKSSVEARLDRVSKDLQIEIIERNSSFNSVFAIYIRYRYLDYIKNNSQFECDTSIKNAKISFPIVNAEILESRDLGRDSYVIRTDTKCPSFIRIVSYDSISGELKIRFRFHFQVYLYSPNGAIRGMKRFVESPDYYDFDNGILHCII